MKIKAVVLSLVLLAPTAGAAAAQVESASAFRVQTGKAPATPAQDFRVSYAKTAVSTTPTIFAKSNLPKALSDAELDEVTGEALPILAGRAVGGAVIGVVSNAATNIAQGKDWYDGAIGAGVTGAFTGGSLTKAGTKVITNSSDDIFSKTFNSVRRIVSPNVGEIAKPAAAGAAGGAAQGVYNRASGN